MKLFWKRTDKARAARDCADRTEEKLDTIYDLAFGLMGRICM